MNTNQTQFDQLELDRIFELRTQSWRLSNKIFEIVFSEQSESLPYPKRFRLHRLWLKSQARYDRRCLAWHKVFELADVGRSPVRSAGVVGQESNP
ncbi:MAG: hypothetical protein PHH11_06515 [Methylomonas sp.]|nr:hypothetical protein [Methylomonas sp.]